MVESPELAHPDCLLDKRVARVVDDVRAFCGLAENEIVVDCAEVKPALTV